MALLTGSVSPNTNIEFVVTQTNEELLRGLTTTILSDASGNYTGTIVNGAYNIIIGARRYSNVTIDRDGSLNDFLGDANGRNM